MVSLNVSLISTTTAAVSSRNTLAERRGLDFHVLHAGFLDLTEVESSCTAPLKLAPTGSTTAPTKASIDFEGLGPMHQARNLDHVGASLNRLLGRRRHRRYRALPPVVSFFLDSSWRLPKPARWRPVERPTLRSKLN